MQTIPIAKARYMQLDVKSIEVFPETWDKRHSFALYRSTPRPVSAILFICSDIKVNFYSDEGVLRAGLGDVVYIPTGICYHVGMEGTQNKIDTYTVNFSLFAEEEILLSDKICLLATDQGDRFAPTAEQLRTAVYAHLSQKNYLRIKSVFFSLLDEIAGIWEGQSVSYPIRAGVRALANEWNQNKKIESYAALCSVSPAYFYKIFKAWSGKSPVEYRNHLRLNNAAAMLKNTDMSVSKIAELVGFEDPFYFCRIFSKHFGLSPQKYRQTMRQ